MMKPWHALVLLAATLAAAAGSGCRARGKPAAGTPEARKTARAVYKPVPTPAPPGWHPGSPTARAVLPD